VRVLHVVPTYLPAWRHGGPILAVHGLAKALAARGHAVTVFTTDVHGAGRLDVPLATPVEIDGVTVWYFPVGFPRRLYRSPALTAALARTLPEIDLVHLHSVFLWPTWAAARAAFRAGVPYLLAPRGMLVGDLLRRRGWLRKRLWIALA
jgi:glycosyltransferase involved in cell wall biosynthesis